MGIHLHKKIKFVNHTTEMPMKVAKSIGLLYKLNRLIRETIKTLYTSIIHPYTDHMAWRHGMEQIKIIHLKSSFSRRKPYVQ